MVDIERIDDLGVARQVMRLLLAENERLHKRLAELTIQLAALQPMTGRARKHGPAHDREPEQHAG